MTTYKILRFRFPSLQSTEVIKRGLTLKEAQAHCRDPKTRCEGKWFDGYEAEGYDDKVHLL